MADPCDEEIARLVRQLAASQTAARRLGMLLAADLIAAATMDIAIEWTGGRGALSDPSRRLDQLLRMRIASAFEDSGAVVPIINPKGGRHDDREG